MTNTTEVNKLVSIDKKQWTIPFNLIKKPSNQ